MDQLIDLRNEQVEEDDVKLKVLKGFRRSRSTDDNDNLDGSPYNTDVKPGWLHQKLLLLWESLTLLYRLPSMLLYEIDNIIRNILTWIGVRSSQVIRYIAICGRCLFLLAYYTIVFIFPAVAVLLSTVIWLTWSTVIMFYLMYDHYIPRNQLVEIPITFYAQPFVARELWMLGDECHGLSESAQDSIRYVPQPLPFMSIPISGSFTTLEVQCGLSSSLVYERNRLVGGLPMAGCGTSCSLEGMLDWKLNRSDDEAVMSFLPRELFHSVFRGQPVDIGIDLRYDPVNFSDQVILPFEWKVHLYKNDGVDLQRVVRSRVYKSSILARIVRSIIVLIPEMSMVSRHDLYSLFSSQEKIFTFLNIESDCRKERLSVDDLDYLIVELPVDIDLTSLKVVVKPRLTGKAWYLSSFPLSIFLICWCLVLLFCTTPSFLLIFSIYIVLISWTVGWLPSFLIGRNSDSVQKDSSKSPTSAYENDERRSAKESETDPNITRLARPDNDAVAEDKEVNNGNIIKVESVDIEECGGDFNRKGELGVLRKRRLTTGIIKVEEASIEPPSRTERALKASGVWMNNLKSE